jgi:hypothetical protein
MNPKRTFGNHILIKLDPENNFFKLQNGTTLYIDTSFEPEKHATVTGEVFGVPSRLTYTGKPNIGMPWKTPMEIMCGDRAVIYYLSVVNAFRKEMFKAIIEGEDKYVLIQYQNIFAIVRYGKIIPVNGYCLVEPIENPEWIALQERMAKSNLVPVNPKEKSVTSVVYGKVRYCGIPNEEYVDKHTDSGVDVKPGDIVVMKRISDLPLEYDLHAKIDSGKKYWRVQRRNILGVYEKPV